MLIAFSLFSILVACLIAIIFRMRGVRLAYIWLLMFVTTALVLLLILLVDPVNLKPFSIGGFSGPGNDFIAVTFRMTNENRIVGICLFVIVLSFLATETTSPQGNISLSRWIQTLAFSSAAWAALLSANAWTVLISWTILDMLELISQLIFGHIRTDQFLLFYLSKFIGSIVLVLVISRAYQASPQNLLGGPILNFGVWVLLAVFLHARVFIQWKISDDPKLQEKPNLLIQIFLFLPHFFLLSQVPNIGINPLLRITLKTLMFVGASIFAFNWYVKRGSKSGFHHLIASLAFISAFLFLSENQQGLTYFLITLLPMSWIILAEDRPTFLTPLWIVGILMLSGFPFTPQYAAFENLILNNKYVESAVMTLPSTLIMAGLFQSIRKPSGNINRLEKFNQTLYIFGLAFPMVGIILVLWSYRPVFNLVYFWFGTLHIFLFVCFTYIGNRNKDLLSKYSIKGSVVLQLPDFFRRLKVIFKGMIEIIGAGLEYGARLLEEEGGVLWSIVFLSLLLSILASIEGIT
jgi:hypothetical protein